MANEQRRKNERDVEDHDAEPVGAPARQGNEAGSFKITDDEEDVEWKIRARLLALTRRPKR
jgi:hypothetical protein